MEENILKFKDIVIKNFSREDFKYHDWMVEYHLEIVERIAMELCDIYTDADRDVVRVLAWFHDYGKPFDEENEKAITLSEGPKVMLECGFTQEFIDKVVKYWKLMEQKNEIDIRTAPIETQIISSADGASHLVGLFYPSYFNEDGENFTSTQSSLSAKIQKDWERKIVLPEAREAFEDRYIKAKELLGEFPDKFLK